MKWYETFDYNTRKTYWWTQRNEKGICYEIRKENDSFVLYEGEHEIVLSKHRTLQAAIDVAQ
jgi:hypothetical protein